MAKSNHNARQPITQMTTQSSNVNERQEQLLRRLTRLSKFDFAVQMIEVIKWKNPDADVAHAIEAVLEKGADLNLNKQELSRLVRDHVNAEGAADAAKAKRTKRAKKRGAVSTKGPPPNQSALAKEMSRVRASIIGELGDLPPTLQKAELALIVGLDAAMTEDHGNASILAYLGPERRREFSSQVSRLRDQLLTRDWTAPHASLQDAQASELARYYEVFEPVDSRQYLMDLGNELSSTLAAEIPTYSRSDVPPYGGSMGRRPYPGLAPIGMQLWLLGRSVTLRFLLSTVGSAFIRFSTQWQEPSGAWLCPSRDDDVPDPWTTALILHAMCRWRRDANREAIERGVAWLLLNASAAGGWRAAVEGGQNDLDVTATVVALDALRRASIPADHPVVRDAEHALLSAQSASGLWIERGFPEDMLTVIVLEYFRSRAHRGALSNRFLRSASLLLDSAGQMSLSGDRADEQLACIAAYHGLEHFLYGLMLLRGEEDAIYVQNGQQTVGLRVALGAFESLAHASGWLEAGRSLPYRQQLSDLAALRDSFIHRATEIPRAEMQGHIRAVQRFIETFDVQALGFPLQD